MAQEQLFVIVATLVALLAAAVYRASIRKAVDPEDPAKKLPWVGVKNGVFPSLRERFATVTNLPALMQEGYGKYATAGHSFIVPGLFEPRQVIVPSSEIKWIIDQPDDILSAAAAQNRILVGERTFLDSYMVHNPIHEKSIRKDLTRSLGTLVPEIFDEISVGVDEYWGLDTENWKEIGVFQNMMKIVARTTNRMLVGLPLCRNEHYLENSRKFAQDVPISGSIIKLLPNFLRSVFSWIIILPNKWHFYNCSKYLYPLIKERLSDMTRRSNGEVLEEPEPNDFTMWHIRKLEGQPESEKSPRNIALRLMIINFAAIHTSTFGATGILFDIFSTPPEDRIVETIREEIQQVLSEHNGEWSKDSLAKMVKVDSAVRESLRISTFLVGGMSRLVVAPKGVTMNNRVHLSQGEFVGTTVYSIHHDNSHYENAFTYDAFRFSRGREQAASVLEGKNLSVVTSSETFLAFGHGKHACPGRFFAATELKLMLAYIIMNYDIKPLAVRPPNSLVASAILPPMKASISVKRRKPTFTK